MKITIRDWFWLTLVIALAVGWWLDHQAKPDDRIKIEGVVVGATNNLVEVTLGSDDGLNQGMVMEVYRGKNRLGRITIIRLNRDQAVGQRGMFSNARFQKGDAVIGYFKRRKDGVRL